MPSWPIVPSVVYARNELLHYADLRERGVEHVYVVIDRVSGRVIGDLHLRAIDTVRRRFEIGHALDPAWWGTGLSHELLDTIVSFARRNGYMVWGKVDDDNIRSWRSLENYGARLSGRKFFSVQGHRTRMRVYVLGGER